MESSVMRERAERFLEKLEALNEVSQDWEHEIGQGIRLLGSTAARQLIEQAGLAHNCLGQLACDIMEDARLSLPGKAKKTRPAS